ncbi:hypothetical protein KFE25_008570 [Diacronema lutheri]|uniref:C3H1-type domain-containing protein n=1 Tax=Diacronema lutheri TaxID=2081491 RepID=A0A8J5Y2P7_DIALT|nr:hypothetical protein KFE25_008570 [Diacronema lutheri]
MQPPHCRFFAQGRCNAGDACRFSHVLAPTLSSGASTTVVLNDPRPPKLPEIIGPLFSVDVECVATGVQHHDRSLAQIGLVDADGSPVLNLYIKPERPVVSYLHPLTGLSAELIAQQGIELNDALARLRATLPRDAILVGQNILKDVEWLGLKEGVDFACAIDLAALFRVWTSENRYAYFSQDHTAAVWLRGTPFARAPGAFHDALADAATSMALFHCFCRARTDLAKLAQLQQATLSAPRLASFAMQNPVFEGVCQGHRRTCTCGGPFFS